MKKVGAPQIEYLLESQNTRIKELEVENAALLSQVDTLRANYQFVASQYEKVKADRDILMGKL